MANSISIDGSPMYNAGEFKKINAKVITEDMITLDILHKYEEDLCFCGLNETNLVGKLYDRKGFVYYGDGPFYRFNMKPIKEFCNRNQRKGDKSNSEVGKDFENEVNEYIEKELHIKLQVQKKVDIGINSKKEHAFDFGNEWLLVECKSHTWTESGNVPSGKMKNWSDAMFSFYLAPQEYRKLFIVDRSYDYKKNKSLLDYFVEHYYYLIPQEVILADFESNEGVVNFYVYNPQSKRHVIMNDDIKNFL